MSIIAYLNGKFIPAEEASISPLDRGMVFGDGVYEVIPVFNRKILYLEEHLDRLNQSLQGIRMTLPHTHAEWKSLLTTLVEENNLNHGGEHQWIYLQVTRGFQLVRDHQIPNNLTPTVFAISYPKILTSKEEQAQGIKVIATTDIRWKYCYIKTTARLAYTLMYQEAKDAGVDEAIIINNGYALEGTSSNFFMVRHGVISTPPKGPLLLSGITRDKILALAEKHKIPYRENKISERELLKADEIWITSSIRGIYPVVEFNGEPISNGKAGPFWSKMWDYYAEDITNLSLSVSN